MNNRPLTTIELGKIIHGAQAGVDFHVIAENVGRSPSVVSDIIRRHGLKPVSHRTSGRTAWKDFTVYDRKGNVVAYGTAAECAKTLGIKRASFYQYLSRQRHKKAKQPVIIVEEDAS